MPLWGMKANEEVSQAHAFWAESTAGKLQYYYFAGKPALGFMGFASTASGWMFSAKINKI